jgi:hypothetical protein
MLADFPSNFPGSSGICALPDLLFLVWFLSHNNLLSLYGGAIIIENNSKGSC